MHVIGARGIERLGDGNRPLCRAYADREVGVGLAEPVRHDATVVDVPDVEKGVELFQRSGHHKRLSGGALGQRMMLGHQLHHGAGKALLCVLHQERRGRRIDRDVAWIALVGKIEDRDLRLLKRELEETHHLLRVLGAHHPPIDQARQRTGVGNHLLDLVVGRRQAEQQILDLGDVSEWQVGLKRRRWWRSNRARVGTGCRRRGRAVAAAATLGGDDARSDQHHGPAEHNGPTRSARPLLGVLSSVTLHW